MSILRSLLVPVLFAFPLAAANVPRLAPELAFRLVNGQPAKLSQWRGKVILLEFLLTDCPHCQRASQTMNKLQAEFAARGVQAVGVAINDENGSLTAGYVKQLDLKYPVGWVRREPVAGFLQHPPMVSMMMPQLVFIDRRGMIRAQFPGNDKFFENEEAGMRQWIATLLKEPVAKKTAAGKAK